MLPACNTRTKPLSNGNKEDASIKKPGGSLDETLPLRSLFLDVLAWTH